MTNLLMTVDLNKHRLRIHKKTMAALGNPTHVILIVNPESHMIAVKHAVSQDRQAQRLQSNFELYSKSLVSALLDIFPQQPTTACCNLEGTLIPLEQMVCFPLESAVWL